jgi:hypothetical protein
MRRSPIRHIASWVVAAVFAVSVLAQEKKPSFAGQWAGGQRMANLVGVVGSEEMTITQDSLVLKIERPYGQNRVSILLRLDGSESKNEPNAAPTGKPASTRQLTSKAVWQAAKLKITTEFLPQGATQTVITIETLSLEDDKLIVERSDEVIGARQGPLRGGILEGTKLTYRRVSK